MIINDKLSKSVLLTNDVETHSIWLNCLRDKTGEKVIQEGLPLLLDLYAKYAIKTTFFFVADFAEKYPEVVKMVLPYGHEVASHGYTHEVDQAFDVLTLGEQVEHLKLSKAILEDIAGQEVTTFRSPALRINKDTAVALDATGYRIDSSVPSQRLDMFFSYGSVKKLKWLSAPRLPYRTKPDDLMKRGDGNIIEVPLTATLFPYVGTTLRMFPWVTKMQRNIINIESRATGKPVVFDIHPNEFLDESGEERVISRRSSNLIKYVIADLLRSKLKAKNLGPSAIPLYENEIQFYVKNSYKFMTIKKYCEQKGML